LDAALQTPVEIEPSITPLLMLGKINLSVQTLPRIRTPRAPAARTRGLIGHANHSLPCYRFPGGPRRWHPSQTTTASRRCSRAWSRRIGSTQVDRPHRWQTMASCRGHGVVEPTMIMAMPSR
jgi:hypothetical protein